jgi:hypothetical protein
MTPEDRQKLRQLLDSFDETGLIALANKGLVRRATKDLQSGGVSFEETGDAVIVTGPGWTVTMPPAGPVHASDDTKATGVSRQILTATMFLRDNWLTQTSAEPVSSADPAAEEADEGSVSEVAEDLSALELSSPESDLPQAEPQIDALRESLVAVRVESLEKWSAKNRLREAIRILNTNPTVEVETVGVCLTVRLVEHEIEVRFFASAESAKPSEKIAGRLDEALCTAPKSQQKQWVVLAVLALQKHGGATIEFPDSTAQANAEGAPRNRSEIILATRELLEGAVATGLAHPSSRMVERLLTLSVSATGVNLPKLARQLRGLADEMELILSRDAKGDTTRVVDRVTTAHSLVRALDRAGEQPPVELTGRHRTDYEPVGDLDLTGVGAWPWRTGSGFVGLTVLFWDAAANRFLTWSASRPEDGLQRFRPEESYQVETVWPGGSPSTLSRLRFRLKDARVNPLGRLSGSQKSSVEPGGPTMFEAARFGDRQFDSWPALLEFAQTTCPIGLSETSPLDHIVVLVPAKWGERQFDELQQRFVWEIHDSSGQALSLTLPWAGSTENSIEFLEATKPPRDRLRAVVARVGVSQYGLSVEPLSLLSDGTPQNDFVLNPAFDLARITPRQSSLLARLRKKYGRNRIATTMMADGESDEVAQEVTGNLPRGLELRLSEVEQFLLELTESGTRRFGELHQLRLRELATRVDRAGLIELAAAVREADQLDPSSAVIRANYLCRLHRQTAVRESLAGSL